MSSNFLSSSIEDLNNKKQMEFKGGKLSQLISDQLTNTNVVSICRYQGFLGAVHFIVDCTACLDNMINLLLLVLLIYSLDQSLLDIWFPIGAFIVNFILRSMLCVQCENRKRKIQDKINYQKVEYLLISKKHKRFLNINQSQIKPGHILKIKKGQEFPADCLILDIQGEINETHCYVSSGPFDHALNTVEKRSYAGTSSKTSSKQNEAHLADMMSGFLKYEYNYFGYIQGTFKLNQNPVATEFDNRNVAQRGQLLIHTAQVICLVLNVGDQCIGSVFKNPNDVRQTTSRTKLINLFQASRSFSKAYSTNIRSILISMTITFALLAGLGVYLTSISDFLTFTSFEKYLVSQTNEKEYMFYINKGIGVGCILLSCIPLNFQCTINLLVALHAMFIEWDINMVPSKVQFLFPQAAISLCKVSNIFFSRKAILKDERQFVKGISVGDIFFINENLKRQMSNQEQAPEEEHAEENPLADDQMNDDFVIESLPDEVQLDTKFQNNALDIILEGSHNENKEMIKDFFRSITLCHQARVDKKASNKVKQYFGVSPREMAALKFAQ